MRTSSTGGLRSLLLALIGVALFARCATGVIIYRIGSPLSTAEKDSLEGIGIDFEELDWSASQLQDALDLDSLEAGSLQPNFFDEDEDIAATVLRRDGWVGINNLGNNDRLLGRVLVDQDPATAHTWQAIAPESFNVATRNWTEQVTFDLGGRFRIREVRLRPSPENPEHFLEWILIGVSDRGFRTIRIPDFPPIGEVKENTEPEVSVILDPPVSTEAVQLRVIRRSPKEIGIADVEIYGGGFVSQASYESEVIELADIASWGEISWSGRRDPHARVDIRTRSGTDPQPEVFWEARTEQQDSVRFLQGGGDLNFIEYKRRYDRLADVFKPADERDWVSPDTEHWSFWSSLYPIDHPGVDVVSPGQRRYFQLRVDFASTVDDGSKIDYIEFKASSPPAVSELVGEIFPIETEVGAPTRFTYYIRPAIASGDSSFDGVEISTPSGVVSVSVDSLRIDGIDHRVFARTIHEDGLGFEVLLPRKLEPTDSGALIEVVFNASVLREVGTLFEGRIFDTARPQEVRQRINAGNATNKIGSDQLSVTTSLSSSLLFTPQIAPNPFTPNGDGINDVASISYKLLRVTAAVPVAIEIFDLLGRLVKQVYAGSDVIGEYSHEWDGRDNLNRFVPPGLYLFRIAADVQAEHATHIGIVSVAY